MSDSVSVFCPDKKLLRTATGSLAGIEPAYTASVSFVDSNEKILDNTEKSTFAIITGIELKKLELATMTPTIGSQLFLYVGGESYYNIAIKGIAFVKHCENEATGFTKILNYYEGNNVKKKGKFVKIALDSIVYKGYLVGIETNSTVDNEAYFTFTLHFYGIPSNG